MCAAGGWDYAASDDDGYEFREDVAMLDTRSWQWCDHNNLPSPPNPNTSPTPTRPQPRHLLPNTDNSKAPPPTTPPRHRHFPNTDTFPTPTPLRPRPPPHRPDTDTSPPPTPNPLTPPALRRVKIAVSGPAPAPRVGHSMVPLHTPCGTQLFLFGGRDESDEALADLYALRPKN